MLPKLFAKPGGTKSDRRTTPRLFAGFSDSNLGSWASVRPGAENTDHVNPVDAATSPPSTEIRQIPGAPEALYATR